MVARVHQRLAYARRLRTDRSDQSVSSGVVWAVLFQHFLLPTRTLAFWSVLWVGLLTRAVLDIFRCANWLRAIIVVGILSTCILAASLWIEMFGGLRPTGVITAVLAIARQGEGYAYEPSFGSELSGGTGVRLLEDRGAWWHDSLVDGRETWIASWAAELV